MHVLEDSYFHVQTMGDMSIDQSNMMGAELGQTAGFGGGGGFEKVSYTKEQMNKRKFRKIVKE